MGGLLDLWRREPAARPFSPAVLQSALGNGAAYVASAVTLCAAMMNVAEVLLARRALPVGGSGFAAMVAVFGVGMVAGARFSGRSAGVRGLTLGYIGGMAVLGLGLLGSALAPSLPVALVSSA